MEPKIRIAGYEQVVWGDGISIYPRAEGSHILERTLTFVNYGGPHPQGKCSAISPLSFPAIQFEWLETNTFPIEVVIQVDATYFTSGHYPLDPNMVKDNSTRLSSLVRKSYRIPIDFFVGGQKTMYTLWFDLEYSRELTLQEKNQLKKDEEFLQEMWRRGKLP
jgi:hypothetical protein